MISLSTHLQGDVGSLDANSTLITLGNQTYNNSIPTTNLTATYASEVPTETTALWTRDGGLDSYLTSSVSSSVPVLSGNGTADSPSR